MISFIVSVTTESQTAEAKLKDFAGDTIAVQLYLTLKDEKVTVNQYNWIQIIQVNMD